jgi:hypothetical protein
MQELDTDEVLKQLKFVNMVKFRPYKLVHFI